jgi:hypothetical protein
MFASVKLNVTEIVNDEPLAKVEGSAELSHWNSPIVALQLVIVTAELVESVIKVEAVWPTETLAKTILLGEDESGTTAAVPPPLKPTILLLPAKYARPAPKTAR